VPHDPVSHRRIVIEVSLLVLAAVAALLAAEAVGRLGGVFADNQGAITALFFLVAPWWMLRRRGLDPAAFALNADRPWQSALVALVAAAIVFPPYILGFAGWVRVLDGAAPMWSAVPGIGWWAYWFFVHLVVVAVPEEAFFRGYVQGRLAPLFPRRVRLLGVSFGGHIVVASALFALVHLVAIPAPFRLAVFFPGLLFGWLRERTGSIVAPALLHAASNVLLAALNQVFG
jgi:membrane protease YdiL (CAAX protease family)